MKKIMYLLLLLSVLCPAAWAQKEYGLKFSNLVNEDLSLESAIRLGLENNSEFLTAKQDIIIAEQKLSEAKFRYLPQFAVQGTATFYEADYPMVLPENVASRVLPSKSTPILDKNDRFFGVGITATQYIYSGGRIHSTLKTARANLKQVQSRYETVKNTIVRQIKIAFANLLYAQHNEQLTLQVWQQAQAWQKNSSADVWTKMQEQALLAQFQSQYNRAVNAQRNARMDMLAALNKELNASFTIVGDFEPLQVSGDLPHFQLWALEFRPELKSAIYELELDNIAIDLALAKRYPDVILNAAYEKVGSSDLDDVNKQVSLSVQLPLTYTISKQIAQKRAEQKKNNLRRAAIEDKIQVQVATSFENNRFWQEEVLNRQATYNGLEKMLTQDAKQAPHTGLAPLHALQAYLQTAQLYLQAVRENHIAKAQLEWAIGQDL